METRNGHYDTAIATLKLIVNENNTKGRLAPESNNTKPGNEFTKNVPKKNIDISMKI